MAAALPRFNREELEALVLRAYTHAQLREHLRDLRQRPRTVSGDSPFGALGPELTVEVLRHADTATRLVAVTAVCRAWRDLRHHPRLWETVAFDLAAPRRLAAFFEIAAGLVKSLTLRGGDATRVEELFSASPLLSPRRLVVTSLAAANALSSLQFGGLRELSVSALSAPALAALGAAAPALERLRIDALVNLPHSGAFAPLPRLSHFSVVVLDGRGDSARALVAALMLAARALRDLRLCAARAVREAWSPRPDLTEALAAAPASLERLRLARLRARVDALARSHAKVVDLTDVGDAAVQVAAAAAHAEDVTIRELSLYDGGATRGERPAPLPLHLFGAAGRLRRLRLEFRDVTAAGLAHLAASLAAAAAAGATRGVVELALKTAPAHWPCLGQPPPEEGAAAAFRDAAQWCSLRSLSFSGFSEEFLAALLAGAALPDGCRLRLASARRAAA